MIPLNTLQPSLEANRARLRTLAKLNEFRSLPVGWHYGSGVPLRPTVHSIASSILERTYSFGYHKSDAFPGVDGGVMLVLYDGDTDHELRIFPSGRIRYLVERDGEEVSNRENVSDDVLMTLLRGAKLDSWNSSEPYIKGTLTLSVSDLEASRLNLPQMAVFLYSTANVLNMHPDRYVSISRASTPGPWEIRQSIGSLPERHYPPVIASKQSRVRPETRVTGT